MIKKHANKDKYQESNLGFVFHLEMNSTTAKSKETNLAHSLLASKYLVVVLGMKSN
jgi:hypothetical protein